MAFKRMFAYAVACGLLLWGSASHATPQFQQISPHPTTYIFAVGGDYTQYFGSIADITAPLQAVALTLPPTPAPSSTSGCNAADFFGFTAGSVALLQRGGCNAAIKATNAFNAGAVGALVFNEGQPGRTDAVEFSYAGLVAPIPTFNLSYDLGSAFAAALAEGPVIVRLRTEEVFLNAPVFGAVPEPSTWAMMISGLILVGGMMRRRQRLIAA